MSLPLHQQVESMEIVNPLLDQSVQPRDGQLILPGNKRLASLNLAGQCLLHIQAISSTTKIQF